MENLRKRVDVKLVRSHEEDKPRCLIAGKAFARANIFDDDLAAIQLHKSRLLLNRPVFVRMSILDLSKHLIYDVYCIQLRRQYGATASSSSLRSRLRMCARTWPRTKPSTIYLTTPKTPYEQCSQQEGSGEVERWVRWAGNCRICWPAPKDVQHPRGLWGQHKKGQGLK